MNCLDPVILSEAKKPMPECSPLAQQGIPIGGCLFAADLITKADARKHAPLLHYRPQSLPWR
jgi:hypothetical protein